MFMEKINFINFNNFLAQSTKDQLISQQNKCRQVILNMKKEIMNVVSEIETMKKINQKNLSDQKLETEKDKSKLDI